MKNVLLILFLVFGCQFSQAQVWGHSGAKWHYKVEGIFKILYTISYESDTIVGGSAAQKIKVTSQNFYPQPGGVSGTTMAGPMNSYPKITRFSGDSVFLWDGNQYFLMYDFGASVGDEWIIGLAGPNDEYCDSLSRVQVVSTGLMNINGQSLRTLQLASVFGSARAFIGTAVERIGMIYQGESSFLFPTVRVCDTNVIAEYFQFNFLCYEDDNFTTYNETNQECDHLAIYAGLNELDSEISISPNPVKNKLTIKNGYPGFARYSIVDYHGKIWKEGDVYVGFGLDVSELPPGFYLLRLEKEGAEVSSAKFLKE